MSATKLYEETQLQEANKKISAHIPGDAEAYRFLLQWCVVGQVMCRDGSVVDPCSFTTARDVGDVFARG